MGPNFLAITGMFVSFGFTFAVVWLLVKMRTRRYELRAEVQTKLIDRFGSSQELIDFLQSPTGREFVEGVQNERFLVHNRAMAGIRKAIILSFLGVGLISIWGLTEAEWVSWFGIIFLALGIGYLVAAFVSMRLGRESNDSRDATSPV
jgi:hypothetical protein